MSATKTKKTSVKKERSNATNVNVHQKSVILPERTTFLLVHNLHQSITSMFDTLVSGKTTVNQFEVLRYLLDNEAVKPSPTSVVEYTSIDRTTMSQLLYRMIGKGWVIREDDPLDGRIYRLTVTVEGRQIYDLGLLAMIEIEEKLQNVFGFDVAAKWIGTVNKLHPYVTNRSKASGKAKPEKTNIAGDEPKHAEAAAE